MTGSSELRLHCLAHPAAAKSLRHALATFLAVIDIDSALTDDVLTAVGEALVNVVEHAYSSDGPGELELFARIEDDAILVDVYDRGTFIERDGRRAGAASAWASSARSPAPYRWTPKAARTSTCSSMPREKTTTHLPHNGVGS